MSPVIEKIIDIHPDAILLSPFENSGGYGKLEDLDIPLVECAEYMEVSPLARAEWMRFYGLLFGKQKKADKLFAEVDESYNDLKQEAEEAGEGRSVMMDKLVGSVWYVPGGRSTIGQMIKDAGGRYPWEDDEHSGCRSRRFLKRLSIPRCGCSAMRVTSQSPSDSLVRRRTAINSSVPTRLRRYMAVMYVLHGSMRSRLSILTGCSTTLSTFFIRMSS